MVVTFLIVRWDHIPLLSLQIFVLEAWHCRSFIIHRLIDEAQENRKTVRARKQIKRVILEDDADDEPDQTFTQDYDDDDETDVVHLLSWIV